jgi:tetratricopeptide (TPR) repeat protein
VGTNIQPFYGDKDTMLKARKKITKKEIQKDRLLGSLFSIKTYIDHNKQKIIQISIGTILAVIVIIFLNNKRLTQNEAAETALGEALVNLTIGDIDNGLLMLELLVDDYSGSRSAQKGLYFLGKNYYEKKDYLTAKSYLNDFLDDPSDDFHASALMILAEIEKINLNTESAIDYYKEAIKYATTDLQKIQLQINLTKYFLKTGYINDAKSMLEVISKPLNQPIKVQNEIDEIMGRIDRAISDEQ